MQKEKQNVDFKRLDSVAELIEIASHLTASTIVVPGGDRVEDLRLVESARDHGIIDRIILIGRKNSITQSVKQVGIEIDTQDIIVAEEDEQIAAAAVELIKAGNINIVLKGNIPTPVMNRHILPLAVRPTVSLASIFDAAPIANGRPMILTDAGFTTVCNFGRMVDLIRNAVDLAQTVMEINRPRVAILSANEKQVVSLPSTQLGLKLAQRNWQDAVVCGPLSFDLATDPESVSVKGVPDLPNAREVAGKADILVCPGIDVANVLYKTITAMSKYGQASLSGITMGFPIPYIILSRADTLETRLNSIALCSIYSQRVTGKITLKARTTASAPGKIYRVLVVNPGSTSLKIAVYENSCCIHSAEVEYPMPANSASEERNKQIEDLKNLVKEQFQQFDKAEIDAVAGRGGFLPRPAEKLQGGTYLVAEKQDDRIVIEEDIVSGILHYAEKVHAGNLGIPVAAELAKELKVPAFTVDPVGVDEFKPEAELSGYAHIKRQSVSHVLSVRAAAKIAAQSIGRPIEDINLVVAHLGGGITIAPVVNGRMIDNNIALLGGGPFTPHRTGQLPTGELIALCYSGKFKQNELIEELTKHGGLESYLGEHRMEIIEERIKAGDEYAQLVVDAMIYQIAKEIGAAFVAAGADVEAIVLTGGLICSKQIKTGLRRYLNRLAPVMVFEGSLEMQALASGAVRVLSGTEKPHRYKLPDDISKRG